MAQLREEPSLERMRNQRCLDGGYVRVWTVTVFNRVDERPVDVEQILPSSALDELSEVHRKVRSGNVRLDLAAAPGHFGVGSVGENPIGQRCALHATSFEALKDCRAVEEPPRVHRPYKCVPARFPCPRERESDDDLAYFFHVDVPFWEAVLLGG